MGPSFHATVLCATSRPSRFLKNNLSAAFVFGFLFCFDQPNFSHSFHFFLARYQSCPLLAFRFLFSLDQLSTLPPFRFFHARCQCWLFTLEVFILCASAFKRRMLLECCNTRVATSCNFPFFSTKQHQGTDTLNDKLLRDSIQLSLQFNPKLISSLLVL